MTSEDLTLDRDRPEPVAQSMDDADLSKVFRALGHPARLAIVETLAGQRGACCGQIVDGLPLAQSTVSQHLQVLKEVGLLTCETKGRSCHYALNIAMLSQAAHGARGFFDRLAEAAEAPLAGGVTSQCGDIPQGADD